MWFGTNHMATATQIGFTSERHHRVTRGHLDVHVPSADFVGETRSRFVGDGVEDPGKPSEKAHCQVNDGGLFEVEPKGVEPSTSALRTQRSPK